MEVLFSQLVCWVQFQRLLEGSGGAAEEFQFLGEPLCCCRSLAPHQTIAGQRAIIIGREFEGALSCSLGALERDGIHQFRFGLQVSVLCREHLGQHGAGYGCPGRELQPSQASDSASCALPSLIRQPAARLAAAAFSLSIISADSKAASAAS
jgi:hypothetical protein